ncbi:hypothetical protein [Ruegeria arenilitoris]|uniref:hypothetical protein n=1 Tax=Ruegeria arenilitoris TaxID=1173585 RepID=UPI0014799D79|nr:hypothetical protein [Ruegeria arenilitoris]
MAFGYQKVGFPEAVVILGSSEVETLMENCVELAKSQIDEGEYVDFARSCAASVLVGNGATWEHVLNRALSLSDIARNNLASFQFVQSVHKENSPTLSQEFSSALPVIFQELGFVPTPVIGEADVRRMAQPIFDGIGKAILVEFDLSKPKHLGVTRLGLVLCEEDETLKWTSVADLANPEAARTLEQVHKAIFRSEVFDRLQEKWANITPDGRLNVAITPLGILAVNTQAVRQLWEEQNSQRNLDSFYREGKVLRPYLGPIAPGMLGFPDPETHNTTIWLVDQQDPVKIGDLSTLLCVAMSIIDKFDTDLIFAFVGYKWDLRSYFSLRGVEDSDPTDLAKPTVIEVAPADHAEDIVPGRRIENAALTIEDTLLKSPNHSRFRRFVSWVLSLTSEETQRDADLAIAHKDEESNTSQKDLAPAADLSLGPQTKLVVVQTHVGQDPNDPVYRQETLLSLTARELDQFFKQLWKKCDPTIEQHFSYAEGLELFNERMGSKDGVQHEPWEVTKSYVHILSSDLLKERISSKMRTPAMKVLDERPQRLPETVVFPELGLSQKVLEGEESIRQAAQPLFDKGVAAVQLAYFDDRKNPEWHRQEAWLRVEREVLIVRNRRLTWSHKLGDEDIPRDLRGQIQKAVEDSAYMSAVDQLFQCHVPRQGHSLAVTPYGVIAVSGALFKSNLTDILVSKNCDNADWSLEAGRLRTLLGPCNGGLTHDEDSLPPAPLAWFVDPVRPPKIGSLEELRQIAIRMCEVTGAMGPTVHMVGHAIQAGQPGLVVKTQ